MRRDQITELHYLTPISNLESIVRRGLLSHVRSASIRNSSSIANQEVQDRRHAKTVPRGRPLHEYVNLYLNARNPMMYCQTGRMNSVCVVRVSPNVLELPGVVITDRNAAADMARFASSPGGLSLIDENTTFARYWTHAGDPIAERDHKQRMCAEVLVPDQIGTEHIVGCYVNSNIAEEAVRQHCQIPTVCNRYLFFS